MKIKFAAILNFGMAIEDAKRNGYSLQYVLIKDLFISVAGQLGIDVEF